MLFILYIYVIYFIIYFILFEYRKSDHHHRTQHIRTNLGTKFDLKQTTLNLWTKLRKMHISKFTQKKLTSPLNSAYLN